MFTVTVARAILVTIREIGLGEMVGIDPIVCQPLRDPSHYPNRPVLTARRSSAVFHAVGDFTVQGNRKWRSYL
jgi:hypothetical protein